MSEPTRGSNDAKPRGGGTGNVGTGFAPPRGYPEWTDPPIPSTLPTTPGGDRTVQSGAGLRTAALVGPGHRIPILYGRCLITPDIVRASMANYRAEFDVVLSEGPISAVESWLTDPGTLEATTLSLGSLSPTAGLPSWSIGLACARLRTAAGRPYQPRCIARGRKLYDPRLGSWGAGTYPDAAHCAYSTNPALAFVDATLFPQYGYAYPRVPPSLIDWTSVADAADWCDGVVAGEKRYELNIFLQAGSDSSVWLDTIGLHAGLRWRDEEGLLRLDYSAPVATVLDAITDDHIVADSKPRLVYGSGAGLKDRPNRFRAEWIDPASDWSVRTVEIHHPEVDAGAAIRDAQVYKLHGFQSEAQTLRALWRIAHEIWSEVELEAQLTAERLDIIEGARVPVILPSLGLFGAEFLVTKVTYETDTVTIAGRRYDPDTWTAPGATSGALPGPSVFDTPPALAGVSFDPEAYTVDVVGPLGLISQETRYRIAVEYDLPTAAFSSFVRLRLGIGTPGGTTGGIARFVVSPIKVADLALPVADGDALEMSWVAGGTGFAGCGHASFWTTWPARTCGWWRVSSSSACVHSCRVSSPSRRSTATRPASPKPPSR